MCKVLKHHGVRLGLSSQARKAAWPFETKSYALGSRKRYFSSVGRRVGWMPRWFSKVFWLSYSTKKLLLLVAYRDTMFGKTVIVF